jgi:hypothetical protein
MFASEVCGLAGTRHQSIQINQRRQIDPRKAFRHAGADHRINHPCGDRNDDARRTQNLKKLACRSPLNAPHANLMAEIGMPAVMNLQLLTDMGRMNGRWLWDENRGSSPVPNAALPGPRP